ncbi:hypothetical protein CASFOL_008503 [Castilleja foliolosa]|uniref:Fe2OG dioxygenase domain-containing protein n=1 Tax=Castilleja foliolosa TaxID=1961234 RepID=A0ABD3DZ54_9LAMI
MESINESSNSFRTGLTAQERGFSHVPECYKVQPSHRALSDTKMADVPEIDLDGMFDPSLRSIIVEEIAIACRRIGFFQVVNHGIPQVILDGAMKTASDFFNLPTQHKAKFMSTDLHNPVRYSTSLKNDVDKVKFWRIFLKQYAHPLQDWIGLWPDTPSDYRKKMGAYCKAVQKLAGDIMEAITEGLGLGQPNVNSKLKDGSQVMVVNCYPPCPEPELTLGLPPHSDYSCLTILLQDSFGLQIHDPEDDTWKGVPVTRGALQVHVGDHVEVLSNGRYKSVVHKATLNSQKTRISMASLHSLGMDEKMESAKELVDEENPRGYRASSFRDFLDFVTKNDIGVGSSFLETLKIPK